MTWIWLSLIAGCGQREAVDIGDPCFTMPVSLPGTVAVLVTTTGGPESGSCYVDKADDGTWVLETSFLYNRRAPFEGQTLAIRYGSASCSAEIDGDDPWVVHYRGDSEEVPVDGEQHCFVQTYEGGFEPAPEGFEPWTSP